MSSKSVSRRLQIITSSGKIGPQKASPDKNHAAEEFGGSPEARVENKQLQEYAKRRPTRKIKPPKKSDDTDFEKLAFLSCQESEGF